MGLLVAALVLVGGAYGIRHAMTPNCPRCGARKWDRKLCRPLLMCRRCATRIDTQGRVFN